MSQTDPKRELLRHTVATLGYRSSKTLRDAPNDFASFRIGETTRTPGEILAHMGDLLDWAFSHALGGQKWNDSTPLPWEQEVARFFEALKKFDDYLASDAPLNAPGEKKISRSDCRCAHARGTIGDAATTPGRSVRGENYFRAEIEIGRVGPEQSNPRMEFDREHETGKIIFPQ